MFLSVLTRFHVGQTSVLNQLIGNFTGEREAVIEVQLEVKTFRILEYNTATFSR